MAPLSSYIKRSFNVIHSSLYKSQYLDFVANGYLIKERRKCLIKNFNKLGSALLAACVLFTSVPVNALSAGETYTEQQTLDDLNTENKISTEESNATSAEVATDSNVTEDISISDISSNDIDSSEEKLNNEISLQNDNTEDGEEPPTDNWELGIVFYDSTVDNGKTPLTSIDWDASDGGCGNGTPRVITVQINYKNTNAVTTYQPGQLKISIPNLMYRFNTPYDFDGYADGDRSESRLTGEVLFGANDSTHTGYDWTLQNTSTYWYTDKENHIFTNANIIEEKSNFEGSIQIVYTLTPVTENGYFHGSCYPERYEDECVHSMNKNLQAQIEGIVNSNIINFNYTRTYIHPWKRSNIPFSKTVSKITSYDGLGDNASDYIWVKYTFKCGGVESNYPYLKMNRDTALVYDTFPKECIIYNNKQEQLLPSNEEGEYIFGNIGGRNYGERDVYVGYPKSIYNEENDNLIITNTADYYGYWEDEPDTLSYLNTASVTLNLAEFDFAYSGNLYGIEKNVYRSSSDYYMSWQDIENNWEQNTATFIINPTAIYTGKPMTLKIGDDLLYATDDDNGYSKLNEDEYYFTNISLRNLKNGNGNVIPTGKYNCELWVKRENNTEYELFQSFSNGNGGDLDSKNNPTNTWNFTDEDKVVKFYFIIYDMKESLQIKKQYTSDGLISTKIKFIKANIPQSGNLCNFSFLEVLFKNSNGDLILQNEATLDNYNNLITKEEIAEFDIQNYGHYLQRSTASERWKSHTIIQPTANIYLRKELRKTTQDVEKEQFVGQAAMSLCLEYARKDERKYGKYDENYAYKNICLYDLLPEGMELTSSAEQIKNSFYMSSSFVTNPIFCDLDGNDIDMEEIKDRIYRNIDIAITKNWNSTGRTKLEIVSDFSDEPFFFFDKNNQSNHGTSLGFVFDYSISYDAFLDKGNVWTNYGYASLKNMDKHNINSNYRTIDNGTFDKEASDINENGNLNENLLYSKAKTTITSVVSTHQDVTKYVQTDKNNYSTGTVKASPDSEYTYKLRVRTGQNDVTNLVIYDSIEEYSQDKDGNIVPAYGTKKHWNGEFLGVDTSYAENKGYKIRVYYSENKQAGNLSEDNSWKEYSDSVDKSKVKSLAFEYFNKDDETQKAVLPANSQTYVLVKMKAPPEENRKILSYNGCHTQWQALDDYDRPVDFITGINSNIVKVSLSDYYDLTVNKTWEDENNKWGFRPESIDIILKKDGVEVERKQITKDNLSVTFTDLLVEDSDRYTIEEAPLLLYSSSIEYNELEDCYEITNTLRNDIFTDISGTKTWVGDTESKRPESITIKLLKDGEVYRTTTTNAEKDWKYIFPKVPIYNADETRCIYSVEEIPIDKYSVQYTASSNGLAIKFNSQCRTENANYDYVEIYYKQDGQTFKLGKWGGTALAGKTVNVPTNDFYLYWRTDGSQCSYYGFSIDSIESAEVSATGTVATLPNYTATEITGTDYPESPNHGNYGNNVKMLWHYTGTLSSDVPAEGLFNIVNTYEGVDSVNLSFVKAIDGTDEAFEKLQLEKDALYSFQVSMKNRETNDIIHVLIDNKNVTTINEVPIGTYVITEKDDMYFDFVSMEALNNAEGITFEKVGDDYVLSITEDAAEEETLQIKVNNKIEPDRPYEDKEEKENLFNYSSNEEKASLLSKIANFFTN